MFRQEFAGATDNIVDLELVGDGSADTSVAATQGCVVAVRSLVKDFTQNALTQLLHTDRFVLVSVSSLVGARQRTHWV